MSKIIYPSKKDKIDVWCNKYQIYNYTINSDGSIDVDGNVYLAYKGLIQLPLRFGKVSGDFNCYDNELTSLVGAPTVVGGGFDCSVNKITSLVGGPNSVGGFYNCDYNCLNTLEGFPSTSSLSGDFMCEYNEITSTYSGDIDIEIDRLIHLHKNPLPQLLQDNMDHIKLILKYQRHFFIWNDDLTFNEKNFQILLDEINDGLQ